VTPVIWWIETNDSKELAVFLFRIEELSFPEFVGSRLIQIFRNFLPH